MTQPILTRTGTVIRTGDSLAVTLSRELDVIGLKEGDRMLVSTDGEKIEIVKDDYYYVKNHDEARKG
jgi:hypothetical protein